MVGDWNGAGGLVSWRGLGPGSWCGHFKREKGKVTVVISHVLQSAGMSSSLSYFSPFAHTCYLCPRSPHGLECLYSMPYTQKIFMHASFKYHFLRQAFPDFTGRSTYHVLRGGLGVWGGASLAFLCSFILFHPILVSHTR